MNIKNLNLFILLLFFFILSNNSFSQNIITITKDTVITESLEFTENTIIEGINNPKVTLLGTPKIIANNCIVLVKNMKIVPMANWGTIKGNAILEWYGVGMIGSMSSGMATSTFLDGSPKR